MENAFTLTSILRNAERVLKGIDSIEQNFHV